MRLDRIMLAAALAAGLLLSSCTKTEAPAAAEATAKPQPPPPPPPPETAFGTLVSAEPADRYPVWVLNLTCRGGMCEEMVQPAKGKVVYRFDFEGKKPDAMPAEKKMFLTDDAQKKYQVSASKAEKAVTMFYFVVPETATGLTWSDGEKSVPLATVLKQAPAAAAAGAR
jgi:hypothetical protein